MSSHSRGRRRRRARVFYRRRVRLLSQIRLQTRLIDQRLLPHISILVVPSGQDPDTAHLIPDTENWVAKIKKIARSNNGEVCHSQLSLSLEYLMYAAGLGESRVVLVTRRYHSYRQEFVRLPSSLIRYGLVH